MSGSETSSVWTTGWDKVKGNQRSKMEDTTSTVWGFDPRTTPSVLEFSPDTQMCLEKINHWSNSLPPIKVGFVKRSIWPSSQNLPEGNAICSNSCTGQLVIRISLKIKCLFIGEDQTLQSLSLKWEAFSMFLINIVLMHLPVDFTKIGKLSSQLMDHLALAFADRISVLHPNPPLGWSGRPGPVRQLIQQSCPDKISASQPEYISKHCVCADY